MSNEEILNKELKEISALEIPITPEDLIVYTFRKLSQDYNFKYYFNSSPEILKEGEKKETSEINFNLTVNFNGFVFDPFLSLKSDFNYKVYFCFSGKQEGTNTSTNFFYDLSLVSTEINSLVFKNSNFNYKLNFDLKTFKTIENQKTQNIFYFEVDLKIVDK